MPVRPEPGQKHPEQTICIGELRSWPLVLHHGQLLPKSQILNRQLTPTAHCGSLAIDGYTGMAGGVDYVYRMDKE